MSATVAARRIAPGPPAIGAPMDRPLPRRPSNFRGWVFGIALLLVAGAVAWQLWPRGMTVARDDIRVATVGEGLFRNDMLVRSSVAPLHTVMLDSLDSGRVEEILVSDGASVQQGDLLFRLSNPQLRLDLVAREADRAQQIANLSQQRVDLESALTEHQRRTLDLKLAVAQSERQHERYEGLAAQGYVSVSTLEDSRDQLARHRQALDDEEERAVIEMRIKRVGIRQMEQAVERLEAGLGVVSESIEGLAVRAPISGRLTDFHLQLGEIVKPEQRIGRIDDPGHFKLIAQIEEYYLGRVSIGTRGQVLGGGRAYPVEITRVFPQIREGRFSIELSFGEASPEGLSPGQSLETRIALGESDPAVMLPRDAFLADGGGTWVYVVARDGSNAERRTIRVGRRNSSQVEITAGVVPGEQVIVSGYAGFGDAERLQIRE